MVGIKFDIPDPQDDEEPCTAKQCGFIRALCSELGIDENEFPFSLDDLDRWQASSLIDQLQDITKAMHGEKPFDWSRFDEDDLAELDATIPSSSNDSTARTRSVGSKSGDRLLVQAGAVIVVVFLIWLFS